MYKLVTLLAFATALAIAPACKKSEDKVREPAGSAAVGSNAASTAGSAAPAASIDPEASADHITVLGRHKNPKPSDPVRVTFHKFKVVKADFDPNKIEGGKATIEIDLSSFDSKSSERDAHLKSPAYLDISKFATASIDIDNVKQKAGTTYTADANVNIHGVKKTYPVTFDVVETTSDGIKIKGEHTFSRLDFGIGTDPAQSQDEQVGTDLTIQMLLTLHKS